MVALLLLGKGFVALPIGLAVTAMPIFLTRRWLHPRWRTERIVRLLYVSQVAAAIGLAFSDPSAPGSMFIPDWVASVLGFYFIAAPLFMAASVLYELHRVSLHG